MLGVLAAITLFLLGGFAVQDPAPEVLDLNGTFLPADSDLAEAIESVRESSPDSSDIAVVQILAKGDVLTADSIRVIRDLQNTVIRDPLIEPFLAAEPLAGYVQIIDVLSTEAGLNPANLTDAQIEAGLAQLASQPSFAEANDLLNRFAPRDDAGNPIAGLSLITLIDAGDPLGLQNAELRAVEVVNSADIAGLDVSVLSLAKLEQEAEDARGVSLMLLTAVALAVIAALLIVFYRTQSDVYITMAGLGMAIMWTFGAQAWLSPGGLGIVQRDNLLAALVPVLLISLTVDYALQITSRYRESLAHEPSEADGDIPGRSIATAVRASGVPLLLASGTTAVSLLANLTSKFEPVADFGIVASIGVLSGWVVMTNFVPAARLVMDRRRVAKGREPVSRPIADTIPGAGTILSRVATVVVRNPLPILAGTLVVSLLAILGAVNLNSNFAQKAFLPEGSATVQDIDFLEDNFDGRASTMTILIEADLEQVGAVRDLFAFSTTLADAERRPESVVAPPLRSAAALVTDWSTASGRPDDPFDPAIKAAFDHLRLNPSASDEDARQAWRLIQVADPKGFAEVVDLRTNGSDRTILEIAVATSDVKAVQKLLAELHSLWAGDDSELTTLGGDALPAFIADDLGSSQARSVVLTILAATLILVAYFGLSDRRPMLGLIAMAPVVVVVIWLLGAMFALGISYNVGTALMVVLTIGIGVDYTIHLTHRFTEEYHASRSVSAAMRRSISTVGGALLASALTTALGFLTLLASPLQAMRELAVLASVTIVLAVIVSFALLPPLLAAWAYYHRWQQHEVELGSSAPPAT